MTMSCSEWAADRAKRDPCQCNACRLSIPVAMECDRVAAEMAKRQHGVVFPTDLRSAAVDGSPVAVFPITNFLSAAEEEDYVESISPRR
jgi:hypothetical protein